MRKRITAWGLLLLLAISMSACSSGPKPVDQPAPSKVEPAKPVTAEQGTSKPDSTKPDAAKPGSSTPEPSKPDANKPEPSKPASQPAQPGGTMPLTFSVEQGDGAGWLAFHATGDLKSPSVEYRLGDKSLGSVLLKPDNQGGFVGAMPRPKEQSAEIQIVLLSDRAVVSQAPMRYDTGVMQRWSANFYVNPPVLVDANTVRVEGKARAFEAVFIIEVRKDGKVLARQPMQASDGAPVYGDFKGNVTVPGGVPEGAVVWFMLESMKDGSDLVELIVPVLRSTK